jgi:hypothetical protein
VGIRAKLTGRAIGAAVSAAMGALFVAYAVLGKGRR